MSKRPYAVALGSMVLVVAVLFNLPSGAVSRLKAAWGGLFLPLFGAAHSTQALFAYTRQALTPRQALQTELEAVREENDRLRLRLQHLGEVERENERLRTHVGWAKATPGNLKLGRVLGRDPYNWWRAVHLDLGSRDGVGINYPVLTPQGLVGRVAQVSPHRSLVVLVGDPGCRVAARIQAHGDLTGIIVPSSADVLNPTVAALTFLHRNSEIQPGQQVVTSGQGGIFPKGIPIGQILEVHPMEYGMYLEARVRLAVNYHQLEEAWVWFP